MTAKIYIRPLQKDLNIESSVADHNVRFYTVHTYIIMGIWYVVYIVGSLDGPNVCTSLDL